MAHSSNSRFIIASFKFILSINFCCRYQDLLPSSRNLESTLEQALKQAAEDETFKKIKRISYSANAASEVINFFSKY